MTDILEVGNGGMGGLGGGMMGGLLAGALFGGGLGNNRFDNNRGNWNNGGEGCVTPSLLSSGLTGVVDALQSTTVMQSLGDIKAAIPLAEGQVQLALAGAQADINGNISAAIQTAINGQAGINKNVSEAIASSLASQNNINMNVSEQASAIRTLVMTDGAATRSLISQLNTDNLNRMLTVSDLDRRDEINRGRQREVEVNVTQTVNQNQLQLQAQQQQQQQLLMLSNIANLLGGLQNAVATNSNMIIGNTGASTTGAQTANPVNVRA